MGRNGQKLKADDVVPVAEARSSLLPLLASSVELPDVLTFVFSWQGYQLCLRTKYRGTEHAARQCEISMIHVLFRILDLNSLVLVAAKTQRKRNDIRMQLSSDVSLGHLFVLLVVHQRPSYYQGSNSWFILA